MKCLTSLIPPLLLASAPSSVLARKKDEAVLLSNVKSLTLRDGHQTSSRRVDPLPQLNCVGGDGCQFYKVDVMRCTNSGSQYDSEDIAWTCKANLPPEFKLGSTDVICEGYDNANDPYILKGSCGVEYRLMLTELGEQTYRDHVDHKAWRRPSSSDSKETEGSDKLASALFWLVFVVIVLVILYSIFNPDRNHARDSGDGLRRGYRPGGGGGGGNDDDNDDPPPPYTPRADPRPKKSSNSWYSSRSSNTRSSSSRQQSQGWRPGFWTGTATGAAAGYAAGAYANRDHQRNADAQPGRSSWFGTTNTSPPGGRTAGLNHGGSSYYGGGSSGGGSRWGGGGGASSSNSPPEPSNSRSESTGFGGTRRR
ncbi:store-operated calcium entry-associated regulatory factor-like [Lecanosticta acicola]|uniref:Store-operated calcium entry-associated regulatory factor n=1 Tax=Lecanosticta acicola TaxID=111012 RepID=A0AAI8Z9C2_9PEZI|nr:store-operated calcium entry-associated regulatory factor-like [Lecanosticta acicola]